MLTSRVLAALLAFALPSAALACPPPYIPTQLEGESKNDYNIRIAAHFKAQREETLMRIAQFQSQFYYEAPEVFVAEVVKQSDKSWRQKTFLKPVKWIKGEGRKKRYKVRIAITTSCGPVGGGAAVHMAVGSQVLVMLQPSKDSWLRADRNYALDNIQDPKLRDMLIEEGFAASGGI